MRRRHVLAAGLAVPFVRTAQAQNAPQFTRPLRMLVPYAPGGGADTTARLLAGPMGQFLGQTIVVENRPGAGGSIAAGAVAAAPPDGHTLMLDASAHAVNPALIRNLPFNYATAFAPISQVTVLPQIFAVNPNLGPKTLAEFVALAKSKPGQLTYGSSGNATAAHLAAELFLRRAGLDVAHAPYRGGAPALQDVLGGAIAFVFATVSSGTALVQQGRLLGLGVSSAQRIASLPDVPTIAEQGFPGYELNEWNGLYTVAGTPAPLVAKLFEAAAAALKDSTVLARLAALGAEPVGTPPEVFAPWLARERDAMATLVREARITID